MVKAYPLPKYIWNIAKNSTRAERLSCAASVVALLLCTALIVYFTVLAKKSDVNAVDRAPHPWNITREMWRARPSPNNATVERFSPVKLVIIQHSVSPECHRFTICAAEIRNLQSYFLDSPGLGYDLPYNFAIGNDGRVYRIRGWNREGAHTAPYNRCSVGIGFIGDYREDLTVHSRVTDLQLKRLNLIIQEGVDRGYLRPDYSILGARDVISTYSPGDNLYKAIQALDHYDTTNYRGLTCEQIQEMSEKEDP
ncbi:peptidoglycan recognition protein-like [Choristoneura fumiferana]|uniref:peptidoglycan recognition protein-like n=1 Tax=Choristoneura fumiferana TaxID=7141 RepID=UPI003D153EDF